MTNILDINLDYSATYVPSINTLVHYRSNQRIDGVCLQFFMHPEPLVRTQQYKQVKDLIKGLI